MPLSPSQLAAGLQASYSLRDRGIPEAGIKPVSFTANPQLHVEVIGCAVLSADNPGAIPVTESASREGGVLPDFEALRAERNARHDAWVQQMRAEGWTVSGICAHNSPDACYCACPDGPCEHTWDGKPWESEDGCSWSTTCSRCGEICMYHSMRVGP